MAGERDADGELPVPPGWERGGVVVGPLAGALLVAGATFAVVVVLVTVAGPGPAGLLRTTVPIFLGVWLLAVVLSGIVGGADHGRERRTEVRRSDGVTEWALRFPASRATIWQRFLLRFGFAVLVVGVLGALQFPTRTVGLAALAAIVVVVVALGVAVWGTVAAGRSGIDLTESRLVWRTGGREVAVAWEDVAQVAPILRRTRRRGRGLMGRRRYRAGTERFVGIVARDPERVTDGRRRWPWSARVEEQAGVSVAVPAGGLAVDTRRLYWAVVAFREPARREALLDGAELTATRDLEPEDPAGR